MSKISNVITMLQLLSNGKKYSINELSTILEVTPRMIRVYKDELDKAGIYIESIKGVNGGYVLKKNIGIPYLKFDRNDYELLDKYASSDKQLENLRDKIKALYEVNVNKKDDNYLYNCLVKAIKERRKVKIDYYSYDMGNDIRIINPSDMFWYDNGWYCAAFCNMKKDIRLFELKRINSIEILEEIF